MTLDEILALERCTDEQFDFAIAELTKLSVAGELEEEQHEWFTSTHDVCDDCCRIFPDEDLIYDQDHRETYGEYCYPCFNARARAGTLSGDVQEEQRQIG